MRKKGMTQLTIELSEDERNQWRVFAAVNGKSMGKQARDVLVHALSNWTKRRILMEGTK